MVRVRVRVKVRIRLTPEVGAAFGVTAHDFQAELGYHGP